MPQGSPAVGMVDEGFQDRFLGHKAGQQRDAGHGRGADAGHDAERARGAEHAGELADIAGSGLVVDDSHHQEQGGLEQAVGQQHREAGEGRVRRAQAHHHGQEAQLAHRSVRQDELDVRLAQRPVAAHQHGGQAQPQHYRLPVRHLRKARGKPGHQVDAGLHHRGSMQVGADRGGCRHRSGQPEVEGNQRGLADGAHKDQDDGGSHDRAAWPGCERGSLGEDRRDAVRSGGVAQHDQAHQHGQPAGGGDHQGLERGPPGRQPGAGKTDQQVGQDGGEFPEDEQQEKIVRHHQAEHGAGEGEELRAEAAQVLVLFAEIPGTVDQHQGPDAEDKKGHHPGQGVQRNANSSFSPGIHGLTSETAPAARIHRRRAGTAARQRTQRAQQPAHKRRCGPRP